MSPIDNKNAVIMLISEADWEGKHEMGNLETRVKKISGLLQRNHDIRNDSDIMGEIPHRVYVTSARDDTMLLREFWNPEIYHVLWSSTRRIHRRRGATRCHQFLHNPPYS